VQYAGLAAWDYDFSDRVAEYKLKRDFMVSQLKNDFEIHGAGGAFYLFLKAPHGTGSEFVAEAIRNNLLIIPGNVFSPADTHFRISYAAEQRTLERGCEVLLKLARQK
jgi:aspartate aminotransferase/aminotransferase